MQRCPSGMRKVQALHVRPGPGEIVHEDSSVRPRRSGIVPARTAKPSPSPLESIERANVCAWLLASARERTCMPRVVSVELSTLLAFFGSGSITAPLRVFLFGGPRGRAVLTAEWMKWEFPSMRVVGTAPADDGCLVAEKANEACADVLVVALERGASNVWLAENASLLDSGLVIAAGDVLDAL